MNLPGLNLVAWWLYSDPDTVEKALERPEERTRWLIEQSHHE